MSIFSKIKELTTKVFTKVKKYIYGEIERMAKSEERKYDMIENITDKSIDTISSGVKTVRSDITKIVKSKEIKNGIADILICVGLGTLVCGGCLKVISR